MGQKVGRGFLALFGLTLLGVACSGSSKKSGDTPAAVICIADSRRCVGLNVTVCSSDGTIESIEQTCDPTQTCSDGFCSDNVCVANTKFCKDGAVWRCDSTGSGSTLATNCPSGQFCRDDDGAAYCSNQACTPGQGMCTGNVAATCSMDGSGPVAGGTDCSAMKQGCVQGQCKDLACMPGSKLCQQNAVYLCAQDGSSSSLLQDCGMGQVCDGDLAACRPGVCTPNQLSCDSGKTKAQKCNAWGSDYEAAPTDCAADNKICVDGACKKQVCTPNATFCQDGNVFRCDMQGLSSALDTYGACNQYQHCYEYGGGNYAYCANNDCQSNQTFCDGNIIKTCTKDGTIPATGTDCGDKYCENAACKPKVCEPYTYYCKDGNIYYCQYYGGPQPGEQPQQTCVADTTCQIDSLGQPSCVPLPCSPGDTSCLGNQVGTCSADGNSLTKVTDDCAASSTVCTADLKCAKTSSETIGVAEDATTEYAGSVIGNFIQVRSSRKVTELQANLVLAAPRQLRWLVYEQAGQTLVAKVDQVVDNVSGTGFISSGPISFTLKAGKTYVLGVAVSGGNFISYYDGAPFPAWVSFGSLQGRLDQSYSPTLNAYVDTGLAYQIKVTSTLP